MKSRELSSAQIKVRPSVKKRLDDLMKANYDTYDKVITELLDSRRKKP